MDALAPLGITHVDLPLTARKIWTAMRAADNLAPRKEKT
jgi:hypothetical protein